MTQQRCPVCDAIVGESERYPHHLCLDCAERPVSADGRPLCFGKSSRFFGEYVDTGEEYPSRECFVDGIKCRAAEAYFGGIVIEPVDPSNNRFNADKAPGEVVSD